DRGPLWNAINKETRRHLLQDDAARAEAYHLERLVVVDLGGEHHGPGRNTLLMQRPQDGKTVQPPHVEIEHKDIRTMRANRLERLLAAGAGGHDHELRLAPD